VLTQRLRFVFPAILLILVGHVQASSIAITPTYLPYAYFPAPYSATLTASGGTAPYTFSVTTGRLPAGLTLSSSGVISGIPTVDNDNQDFTVTVVDDNGASASQDYDIDVGVTVSLTAGGTFTRTVNAAPINSQIATGSDFSGSPATVMVTQIAPFPTGITVANIVVTATGGQTYRVNANISCTGAAALGANTVTIRAQNINSAQATATFTVNVISPTPSIAAGSALTRAQGGSSVATIATVSDTVDPAGSLTVTAITVSAGLSVTSIVNTNGTVTANVTAGASAAIGTNIIVLQVLDSAGKTATANLFVNVLLATYPDTVVTVGASKTVAPTAAPATFVSTITAAATGFTGTFAVNKTTGVVSIVNAGPIGVYTVTVTANADGAIAATTFKLTVNAAITIISPPTVTPPAGTTGVSSQFTGAAMPNNITWDFGDGSTASGATVSHTYSAPGAYTVTMTVTDPVSGQALTATLPYTVTPPQFRVRLARFNLSGGNESARITGVLHIPKGAPIGGQTVILNVGGNTRTFVLNSKGIGKSGTDTFSVTVKLANKVVIEQESTFKANISGALAAALKAGALLDASGFPTAVTVLIQFGPRYYTNTVTVKFSGGKAKFGYF
jgi:hypothetical protein